MRIFLVLFISRWKQILFDTFNLYAFFRGSHDVRTYRTKGEALGFLPPPETSQETPGVVFPGGSGQMSFDVFNLCAVLGGRLGLRDVSFPGGPRADESLWGSPIDKPIICFPGGPPTNRSLWGSSTDFGDVPRRACLGHRTWDQPFAFLGRRPKHLFWTAEHALRYIKKKRNLSLSFIEDNEIDERQTLCTKKFMLDWPNHIVHIFFETGIERPFNGWKIWTQGQIRLRVPEIMGPNLPPGPQTIVLNLVTWVPHVPPATGAASEDIPAEDHPQPSSGGACTTRATDVGVDTSPQTSTTTTTTTTTHTHSPSSGPGDRELPDTNPAIVLVEDQSHPHSDDSARCVLLVGGWVLVATVIVFGFEYFFRNCVAEDEFRRSAVGFVGAHSSLRATEV